MILRTLFDRRKDWADIEELVRFGKPDIVAAERWLGRIVGPSDKRLATLAGIVAEAHDEPPM